MVMDDHDRQRDEVAESMDLLLAAHAEVGGEIVSAGGTGTCHLHDRVSEVQAGSYALMDTYYARMALPYVQACWVIGTVIAATSRHAVADVGLKAMGMDHGNPTIEGGAVWFCSDEHTTFAPDTEMRVGDRVRVVPAHVDPTVAYHERLHLVDAERVIESWPIDLRGW